MKKCSKCKEEKDFIFFSKGGNKDGYRSSCKKCCSIEKKIYRNNKKEIIKKSRRLYYVLVEKEKNKVKTGNNKKTSKYSKEYYEKNKTKLNKKKVERDKIRMKNDELFKIKTNLRSLIRNSFKRGKVKYLKQKSSEDILGCSISFFKEYINSKLKKGMTFNNYGEWHLDHIIPISKAKNEEDVVRLNHYTNFQPLWAKDNLSKKDKIIEIQLNLI